MEDFLNSFISNFKMGMRQAALKRASTGFLEYLYDFRGKSVYISNDLVYGHTGVSKAPGAICTKISSEYIIVVNRAFLELSDELQCAIYSHEYGHIMLDHLSKLTEQNRLMLEYEADLYARDILGQDIKAVLYYFLSLKQFKEERLKNEIILRLANLNNN